MQRHLRHREADMDLFRARRDRRREAHRIDVRADAVEVVLGEPQHLHAELVAKLCLLERLLDDLLVLRRFHRRGEEEVAEFHRVPFTLLLKMDRGVRHDDDSPNSSFRTRSGIHFDVYSILIPAAFTTLRHFSISLTISLSNCAGAPGAGSSPCAARTSIIDGAFRMLANSRLRRSMIAAGVFAGATRPCQLSTSKPGTPDWAMLGMSGAPFTLFSVDTPSARSFPDFTCGSAGAMVLNTICTWPPMRSISAGAVPL